MFDHPSPVRHARLFELLRQQNMSNMTVKKLQRKSKPQVEPQDARLLKALAAQSFSAPKQQPEDSPFLAPEPSRDYKFLRTVGA